MNKVDNNILRNLGLQQQNNTQEQKQKLGQDQFLKLMIAQLRNQDPMKPMENGEFLGQMAQFSTVSGIQDLQASFESMATSMRSAQALQATALVGRTVLIDGDTDINGRTIGHLGQSGLHGGMKLDSSVDRLKVDIFDTNGQLVHTINYNDPLPAGDVYFSWDGKDSASNPLPEGKYTIAVTATRGSTSEAIQVQVADVVTSVTLGRQGGLTLNLAHAGPTDLSVVRQVM
ncbi:MAG: flagellar hook assembly protein FlgD [Gammaproteobacteria bacterium]|nr:flagellar hook assembly protein FlgD [Gammaproteobacteria bacterium]